MTAPQTRADVADHLDAAADILLEKGLARRAWEAPDGKVCSNEAIAQVLLEQGEWMLSVLPHRTPDLMNQMCPTTLKAFALYLAGRVLDENICALTQRTPRQFQALARVNPADVIISVNDNTNEDMADAMRHCAKYLREHDVPDRQD